MQSAVGIFLVAAVSPFYHSFITVLSQFYHTLYDTLITTKGFQRLFQRLFQSCHVPSTRSAAYCRSTVELGCYHVVLVVNDVMVAKVVVVVVVVVVVFCKNITDERLQFS